MKTEALLHSFQMRQPVVRRAAGLQAAHRPVLRCFNVKFSPNLGDGLLSECLEQALIELGADPRTRSIDLAARTSYGQTMAGRGAAMTVLDALPPSLRHALVRVPLAINAAHRWRPHFAAGLEGADGVVIGGGNLVSDLDLNFPTKIPLAIAEAERRQLPVAIYAVGVGAHWSPEGLRRCRNAFSRPNVRAVFVRDAASKTLWDELMAAVTGHVAEIVRDPGLLASELFPAHVRERAPSQRPVAGLGIISPIALRYHCDNAPSARDLDRWFVETARELLAQGFAVRVFTNGSPEDVAYAASLHDRLATLDGGNVTFLDQHDPQGLCRHIAGFDVVLAHRMHAVIAAYSYGVPTLALAWDRKLRSFMASVGREDQLFDVGEIAPAECAARAAGAAGRRIPEDQRRAVIAEASADVEKLWKVFQPGDER